MLSLKYENINHFMIQILKLICVSFSYVSISYVLALNFDANIGFFIDKIKKLRQFSETKISIKGL